MKRKSNIVRGAAVAVVGLLAISTLMVPASAHVTGSTKHIAKHMKKFFYTKKQSNKRFINVGETATAATNASNANLLDGIDSSAFQGKCQPGSVKAFAYIKVSAVSAAAFSTAGVLNGYNCTGGTITIKNQGPGRFDVVVAGITGAAGERVVTTSIAQPFCFIGCSPGGGLGVTYTTDSDPGFPVLDFRTQDFEDSSTSADGEDDASVLDGDYDFSFAVYN